MANLTQALNSYVDSILMQRIQELEPVLPKEFFIVEHSFYPDWHFPSSVIYICDTKEEAERWLKENIGQGILKQEGEFSSYGQGKEWQIRIWEKIFERTPKTNGQPTIGIFYRVIKSDPHNFALRMLQRGLVGK